MTERRFIEESFPVDEVSFHSAHEKNIRSGNISTFHTWWARRPLSASRTTIYASLISHNSNSEKNKLQTQVIKKLGKWDSAFDFDLLLELRSNILNENKNKLPKILDPFAGGGSIPLEALRLGCDVYANDYNPISVMILKCILEFPQIYANRKSIPNTLEELTENKLLIDINKWSEHILKKTSSQLSKIFPDKNNEKVIGYTWARKIQCPNPGCGCELPLIKQFWLSKKKNKKISLFPQIKDKKVFFKIVGDGYAETPNGFEPNKGTISRGIVTCLACKNTVNASELKDIFRKKMSDQMMTSVVYVQKNAVGKKYRIIEKSDLNYFSKSKKLLERKYFKDKTSSFYDLIPTEQLPENMSCIGLSKYGASSWFELYNPRQLLVMISFVENVNCAYDQMMRDGYDENYAKVITSYLSLGIDEVSRFNCTLNMWKVDAEAVTHVFGMHTLPMVWDYFENNALGDHGGTWKKRMRDMLKVVQNCMFGSDSKINVSNNSATSLPYEDDFFDAVITDPPYYNSIPYADLSDFFYVWQKRVLGKLFPELFSTPLSPKSDELAELSTWDRTRYAHKTKEFFESNMTKALKEIRRILKPHGICVLVYAHKSNDGWESLINALVNSGLVITASWPINTEMKSRLRASRSAALASSIYIVAKKLSQQKIGYYRDVKRNLKSYLEKKLQQLWIENISGADFFIAAIGSAIEVFGKYEKVVDDADNIISVRRLLNDTREIVTNFAIKQVIQSDFTDDVSKTTRFYILWRWAYGEAKVPFDDALKMGQSTGINIDREWDRGLIVKESENIRVLGPDERNLEGLEKSSELIDVLHLVLNLWKNNKKGELEKLLRGKKLDKSEMFKRVGQAISETLLPESTEKKLLDGFLTRFRTNDSGTQAKLF